MLIQAGRVHEAPGLILALAHSSWRECLCDGAISCSEESGYRPEPVSLHFRGGAPFFSSPAVFNLFRRWGAKAWPGLRLAEAYDLPGWNIRRAGKCSCFISPDRTHGLSHCLAKRRAGAYASCSFAIPAFRFGSPGHSSVL